MAHIPTYDPLAMFYDLFYSIDRDINFYSELAEEAGGNVLELCCGTGRLLIPLAKRGFNITGVDISSNMLSIAKQKVSKLDPSVRQNIKLIEDDIRKAAWDKNFGLIIIAFGAFLELPNKKDRLTVLQRCYDSLKADGGMLAMDSFYHTITNEPEWGDSGWDGEIKFVGSYPSPVKNDETIRYLDSNHFDLETRLATKTITVEHVSENGDVRREIINVNWHYATPEEIKEEMEQAGFNEIEMFGSFDRTPLYDKSMKGKARQIIVARKG